MENFGTVLKIIQDPSVTEEVLSSHGISEEHILRIKLIRERLALLDVMQQEETKKRNQLLEDSSNHTFRIIGELKSSLEDSVRESRKAQDMTKIMFAMTFLLGFVLIGVAVFFGIKGNQVLAIAFGSFGIIDIIAHLIADPPLKIQDSRSNYAQLTVGMLGWFNDLVDKSGMIAGNSQLSAAIQDTELTIDQRLMVQERFLHNYLVLSGAQIDNTVRILQLLDEVAEPAKSPGKARKDNDAIPTLDKK